MSNSNIYSRRPNLNYGNILSIGIRVNMTIPVGLDSKKKIGKKYCKKENVLSDVHKN